MVWLWFCGLSMGPLQLITRYKNRHTGEQIAHWDILNKATKFKFSLFYMSQSAICSMAVFVPCDRQLQRAHLVLVLFVLHHP